MNSPIVSIIVPCYNQGKFIKETLSSIHKQTYPKIECVIVNDGSTDNSLDVINDYCRNYPNWIVIDKKNEGVSIARNIGIANCHGKYILPLDADDIIHEKYVERCVEVLDAHPEYKVVYRRARIFGAVNKEWIMPPFSMENMLCQNCIYCSAMYRKSDFDKMSGYNPNMKEGLEDWDFWISFLSDDSKVFQIDEILFYYRIKRISRNHSFDNVKQQKLRRQIWENNKDVFSKYFMDPCNTMEYLSAIKYKSSCEYKIGWVLWSPFKFLKKVLSFIQTQVYLKKSKLLIS